MAYYERWRSQHDADKYFEEELGFKERLIHGQRIYFNNDTGESLELYRPKQLYEKTVQHGVHLSEGILERLVEKLKELDLSKEAKETLWKYIKEEKNTLNKTMKQLDTTDNK